MKSGPLLSGLIAATFATATWAQTPTPAATSNSPRIDAAKRTDKSAKPRKAVIPDPDLLDGSALEPEKRPLYGMLSEIEMGEKEGGNAAKISPDSGQAGAEEPGKDKTGGAKNASAEAGGSDAKITPGPEAPAEGVQVAELKVPEGAASGGPDQNTSRPGDLQIGDATLQIQTLSKNTPHVVGMESSTNQQYEKKLPSGSPPSGSNRNTGVEKGRVIPKGL
jgi:hypothetical protein